jgi:hypothetical protein
VAPIFGSNTYEAFKENHRPFISSQTSGHRPSSCALTGASCVSARDSPAFGRFLRRWWIAFRGLNSLLTVPAWLGSLLRRNEDNRVACVDVSAFPATHCVLQTSPHTSHKQHFALLLHRPHLAIAALVFLVNCVDCLLHLAEHQVAMAVVCLQQSRQPPFTRQTLSPLVVRTCSRPCSSRSPLSFTNTTSFSDRRTRSSGSLTGLAPALGSSSGEAISARSFGM